MYIYLVRINLACQSPHFPHPVKIAVITTCFPLPQSFSPAGYKSGSESPLTPTDGSHKQTFYLEGLYMKFEVFQLLTIHQLNPDHIILEEIQFVQLVHIMIEIFFSQVVPFQRLHCFSPRQQVILKFKYYKIFICCFFVIWFYSRICKQGEPRGRCTLYEGASIL